MLYAENEAVAREAARAAFSRIAGLEDVFSDYRAHSEIRRLAGAAYHTSVPVSEPMFAVLDQAQAIAAETGGAFDITAGPYVALWRATRRTGALPADSSLAAARRRVGWRHVVLDADGRRVRLDRPGMQLDAGGIAKGYILDEALAVLGSHGVESALIEAGGDIVAGAPPPGKAGWSVAVPDAPADAPIARRARSLASAAIATSGDTEQFVVIDGMRYSHVVDPRTGRALTNRRMATVIAPTGILADAYATALTVMEPDEAGHLIAGHPELTVFVRSVEDEEQ